MQLVMASMARILPTFKHDPQRGRFRAYLFRCTANAITRVRGRGGGLGRVSATLSIDEETLKWLSESGETVVDAEAAAIWDREWVAHHYRLALSAVSSQCDERSIRVFERCVGGASPERIAGEFGMSVDAVYKVRQRMRTRMQEQIARQEEEEDAIG